MLNSDQILERKVLKLENSKGKAAQVGYDLSLKEVKIVYNDPESEEEWNVEVGEILKEKTNITNYFPLELTTNLEGKEGWYLEPAYYEVTFWEGCNIPNDLVGLIRQRSSMLRNGAMLHSSVFDPGFETDSIGSFINVFTPIFIEKDARIAQIYFHECEPVDSKKLYGGKDSQFQNDSWRNNR